MKSIFDDKQQQLLTKEFMISTWEKGFRGTVMSTIKMGDFIGDVIVATNGHLHFYLFYTTVEIIEEKRYHMVVRSGTEIHDYETNVVDVDVFYTIEDVQRRFVDRMTYLVQKGNVKLYNQ